MEQEKERSSQAQQTILNMRYKPVFGVKFTDTLCKQSYWWLLGDSLRILSAGNFFVLYWTVAIVYISVSVAQTVEHCTSNANKMGLNPN